MSTTTDTSTKTDRLVENLRAITETVRAHPDLPLPYITSSTTDGGVHAQWFLHLHYTDYAEQKRVAQQVIRGLGGKWDKDHSDTEMTFTQGDILDPIRYTVQVTREAVCRRVVTGTEQVTVPAVQAQPERVETRETVEWVCEPVLAEAMSA